MADGDGFPTVVVHHKGVFFPNPLVYFDADREVIANIDFKTMGFDDFVSYLENVVRKSCRNVYYCLPDQRLSEGLHTLQNECDYKEFLEAAYGDKRKVNVYVDHHNEPLFDWIEEEDPDPDNVDGASEEVDSKLSDNEMCDHEEDEEVVSTKCTMNDHFLNKLCPIVHDGDDEQDDDQATFPRHDATVEWNKMIPVLGMKFATPSDLKWCLSNYAVAHGYDLWFEKNDKDRLLVKCCKDKTPTCPFRLWASWMKNERTFQIKSLKAEHNCSRAFKLGSIVTYKWIGKQFVNGILEKPKISLRKMKAEVSKKFNLNVSVGQCRNAKKFALSEVEGSLKEHYAKLWDYASEIRRANPGSHVEIVLEPQADNTVVFEKMYISFKGVVDGWLEGCRKVICVDGFFLKGICRGELLSAVGRDPNNHIYPLAWAVVNVESKNTWKWFLDNLMEDIGGGNGHGLTIMSDGHMGLIEAIKERIPHVEHRLCARHILTNFHKRFKGEHFHKPYWKAVNATTPSKFDAAMEEIKTLDKQAFEYLLERDKKCWSKAYFKEGMNCDAYENGVSESFNAAIVEARSKPIITMLEDIRVFVMERLYLQQQKGAAWDMVICPAIRKRMEILKKSQSSGYQQFEVIQGSERYAVDIGKRECGCRSWQLTGIPCVHGIAAIASLNMDPEKFITDCYSKESFMKTYAYSINPLNDSSMWPTNPELYQILPPRRRRLPGRPSHKRKKDQIEREMSGQRRHIVSRSGQAQKCTLCKVIGHNKAKCPSKPSNAGPSNAIPTQQSQTNAGSSNSVPPPQAAVPPSQTAVPPPQAAVPPSQTAVPPPQAAVPPPQTAVPPPQAAVPPPQAAVPPPQAAVPPPQAAVPPPQKKGRVRKPSERLTKLAINRKVIPEDGSGCTGDNPVALD